MLPVLIDVEASVDVLRRGGHVHPDGMLKYPDDLARFAAILERTKPEVVVETGTRTGGSARWFADHGVEVITVDVNRVDVMRSRVMQVVGNSTDPAIVDRVRKLVADGRCMVTLDSDHSGPHVAAEVAAYGPLVSLGCHLVIEDTIFGYAPRDVVLAHLGEVDGTPLDVVEDLQSSGYWRRDEDIEAMLPTSASPAGWWVRV